jgi:membrane-bound lytic murein transglycosylase B
MLMPLRLGATLGALLFFAGSAGATKTEDAAFAAYLGTLWPAASAAGVSRATFDAATRGLTPDPEVLQLAERQPEFTMTPGRYVNRLVTDERIRLGMEALKEHAELLGKLENRYGVSRYTLVAIWGVESNYGTKPGHRNVIRSLATLGHEGRRQRFGRNQLIAALRILERGDISLEQMTGSWAGAMGHTQFIPTTYNAHAVDFTGDGKRDIWNSIADALASTANYLKVSGWTSGETWGYEVELPPRFSPALLGRGTVKTAHDWTKLGVKRVRGNSFPRPADKGFLLAPEGPEGPVFLIVRNFGVIKRYNNADTYALAVGLLADRLAGAEPLARDWPSLAEQKSGVASNEQSAAR